MQENQIHIHPKLKKAPKVDRKPRKKERDQGLRAWLFRFENQQWIILIILSLFMSFLLFPHVIVRTKTYELGDIAERDIKATHDFLLENQPLTEKNRETAVKDVQDIYDFDPSASNFQHRLQTAFSLTRDYFKAPEGNQTPSDNLRRLPQARLHNPLPGYIHLLLSFGN